MAKLMKSLFELDWSLATTGKDTVRQLPETNTELLINRQSPARLLYDSNDTLIIFPTFSPPELTFAGLENDEDHIIRLMNQAVDRLEIQLLSYKPVYYRDFYRKIDNAIRAAAARGVKVRMIVSNWNTGKWDLPYLKSLQVIPGIEIKISNIPQWSGGFIPHARVEHCKYMVVDEDYLGLGTSNWSRSFFQQSRNPGLVIRGKAANDLVHRVFSKSWLSEYCQTLEVCAEYSPPRIKPLD
jgi:phosphatidylserine/phosphatidylglycerophosphate/cardiolipin synthase-like enzyme